MGWLRERAADRGDERSAREVARARLPAWRYPMRLIVVPTVISLLAGYLWIVEIWRVVNIEFFTRGGEWRAFAGVLLGPECMLLVIGGTFALVERLFFMRLARGLPGPGDCQSCGYSLRGLAAGERCPECGRGSGGEGR